MQLQHVTLNDVSLDGRADSVDAGGVRYSMAALHDGYGQVTDWYGSFGRDSRIKLELDDAAMVLSRLISGLCALHGLALNGIGLKN